MKGIRARLNGIYASEAGRWTIGVLAALALYGLALLLQPVITFYDNDDLNIAWALAGYRSGVPSFSHPFLNPVTAAAVSGLYTLFPAVPWWYAVQTFCMLLSAAVMAGCALKLCRQSGLPLPVPLALIVLVYGAACYYALTQVMFTLTSTLLGMGAVALALSIDESDAPTRRGRYFAGSAVLLGMSLLIRQSAGLCAACFYFGSLAIRLFGAWAANRAAKTAKLSAKAPCDAEAAIDAHCHATFTRQALVTAICALAALAALTLLNAWGRASQHGDGFLPFENARAAYMDYPHDVYAENPALYDAIGWDEPLYELVNAWFYMDARVNANTLSIASAQSRASNLSVSERIARGAQSFAIFLGKYPIAAYLLVIVLCAALGLAAVALLTRHARRLPLWGGLAMLLGACALVCYLLYFGRINLRTLMTIAFPALLALPLMGVCALGGGAKKDGADGRARTIGQIALAGVCGALTLVALFCGYKIFRTAVSYDSVEALDSAHAIVDYARANPENVYIRDVYVGNNYDALTVYPVNPPVNLVDWGGCDMYTRARIAQWRANGYAQSPYADVFFDEGVYYICDPDKSYLPLLDAYLRKTWGAAGYEIVDSIADGAAVVRFFK